MEKTFETPGDVRLSVEIHAGLVVVTSTATDRSVVSIEADSPDGVLAGEWRPVLNPSYSDMRQDSIQAAA